MTGITVFHSLSVNPSQRLGCYPVTFKKTRSLSASWLPAGTQALPGWLMLIGDHLPQHFLNFLPLPHKQGEFLAVLSLGRISPARICIKACAG